MLKKIIGIKSVGRFRDCRPKGNIEFRRNNLIFGGNGQGKTTLCAVLRSLAANDPRYLTERQTKGSTDAPEVHLRTDAGQLLFKNGRWDAEYPTIVIYDSEFVHENIYAGELVGHDHKRKLYRVMVGEKGVELATEIDELDTSGREIAADVSDKKKAVAALVPTGVTLEQFIALEDEENLEESIAAKLSEVNALKQAGNIQAKPLLSKTGIPSFPDDFGTVLSSTVPATVDNVEATLQQHLDAHTSGLSFEWLAQGYRRQKGEACPFCAQSTRDIELVESYPHLFGEDYRSLKELAQKLHRSLEIISPAVLINLDKTGGNQTLCDFWSQFVELKLDELSFREEILEPLSDVHETAISLVNKKIAAPLEVIGTTREYEQLRKSVEQVNEQLREYNQQIDQANAIIQQRKEATKSGNLAEEELTLRRLEAAKLRHSENGKKSVGELEDCLQRKKDHEDEKRTKREELKTYSETTFGNYGRRINELLENFGADFQISNIKPKFVGGHPSSNYSLLINDEEISIGDAKTPRGEPAFRSTLSSGDKSSLALAFFIAQLEQQPNLQDMTVVFDDPFSSQDRSRRKYTQQLIVRKAVEVKQTIVVSHDPNFLKDILGLLPAAETKVLELTRVGKCGGTIAESDLNTATQEAFFRDVSNLKAYLENGEGKRITIARTIRPVLEAHLNRVLSNQFADKDWLGDMISKIRDSQDPSPLVEHKAELAELEDINDYSKVFHHDQSDAADETIDQTELTAYVKRTLRVVGSV